MVGQDEVLVAEGHAARAIVPIVAPPSLQVEWVWQSPLSAARIAAPSPIGICEVCSRSTMRSGTSPAAAWVMTAAVLSPMPGSSVSVPSLSRRSSSPAGRSREHVGRLEERRRLLRRHQRPVLQVRDSLEGLDRIHAARVRG